MTGLSDVLVTTGRKEADCASGRRPRIAESVSAHPSGSGSRSLSALLCHSPLARTAPPAHSSACAGNLGDSGEAGFAIRDELGGDVLITFRGPSNIWKSAAPSARPDRNPAKSWCNGPRGVPPFGIGLLPKTAKPRRVFSQFPRGLCRDNSC